MKRWWDATQTEAGKFLWHPNHEPDDDKVKCFSDLSCTMKNVTIN
jgi:hypothetical protein